MPISIIYWGLAAFAATLLAHAAIWRLGRPRREMLWIFALFLLLPVVAVLALSTLHRTEVNELLAGWLIHAALSSAYVLTYPAFREEIPSFRILRLLAQSGAQGMTAEEILAVFEQSSLFADKIVDLASDGLLREEGGRTWLTPAGRLLAVSFRSYRRLLGLESGLG